MYVSVIHLKHLNSLYEPTVYFIFLFLCESFIYAVHMWFVFLCLVPRPSVVFRQTVDPRNVMYVCMYVDPLLGNNLEIDSGTTFLGRQQIHNKQVYAAVTG
jgi:hypothetical protein